MFTDIKDFTLKTSLLTNKQVEKILHDHEEIVIPIVKKYEGNIIKIIGDAFMIVFPDSHKAIDCAIELQKKASTYNLDKKYNLFRIELRISLDKGEVIKTQTLDGGEDYFGEAVNMSSRLESITPENTILVTQHIHEDIKSKPDIISVLIGKLAFKGILYEVEIYKIIFQEREIQLYQDGIITSSEINENFRDPNKERIKSIDTLVFNCACVGAILGIQPIPFIDNLSLIPLHLYMLLKVSEKYGKAGDENVSYDILRKVIGTLGLSFSLLYLTVGLTKFTLPLVGGYWMIPLNFSLTYAIGKIFSRIYYNKNLGIELSNQDIKYLFNDKKLEGKEKALKERESIIEIGKAFQKEIAGYLKEIASKLKSKK